MLTASPITNQPVGKTFTIAIGLLGAGAALELVLIGWAFWQHPPIAVSVQPLPGSVLMVQPTLPKPVATAETTNTPENPGSTVLNDQTGLTIPKPAPLTNKAATPEPGTRFEELVAQGKELRDRSDTSNAVIKFREAALLDTKSPIPLAELAATYDKMSMADKANEQWKKIHDMGPSTGAYYIAAEAKLHLSQLNTLNTVAGAQGTAPEQAPDLGAPVAGIATGATMGLSDVRTEMVRDDSAGTHLYLHVPIKARPKTRINVNDLTVDVLFYDIVGEQNVAPTNAAVNYKWTTPPVDWINTDTEELAVEYQLSRADGRGAKRESRKYYGYIVRIYYKGELQATTADPERLAKQYPAATTLPKDNDK